MKNACRPSQDREVRGLSEFAGQLAQVVMEERRQHAATVAPGQPPGRGPEDVVLAAFRVGQESALTQRVRQPEDAASVDANEVGELPQRHRFGRRRHRLEDGEAAVETLDGRRVVRRFPVHGRQWRSQDTTPLRLDSDDDGDRGAPSTRPGRPRVVAFHTAVHVRRLASHVRRRE